MYVCITFATGATHLLEVFRHLERLNLVSRWRRVGLELELPYDNLEVVQANREGVEDRAVAMLHEWLTGGRATKQALLKAIQMIK